MSTPFEEGLTDIDSQSRYICPECKRDYSGRYIKRHLVKEHGYQYWDGYNVYKPEAKAEEPQTT